MRILVTGGSGFLGRRVLADLRENGYEDVVAPRHAEYDLTRDAHVERMYSDLRPNHVVHLAARVGGIGFNVAHPGALFYETLAMGSNVIEWARRFDVSKVVLASSACAYPREARIPMRESDLWSGYPDPANGAYGVAKRMLCVQAEAYRAEYGLNVVALLIANLYGPGDHFDSIRAHVVPALMRKCLDAQEHGEDEIEVWGTGRASREFLYVDDAARAIRLALERYDSPEPVNVGSGKETTIAELVRLVAEATGFDGTVRWETSKPGGQPRRLLDTARAREQFGFVAQVPLGEGLARTAAWYRLQRERTRAGTAGA